MSYNPKDKVRQFLLEHYKQEINTVLFMTVGDSPIENILFVAIHACCDARRISLRRNSMGFVGPYIATLKYEPQEIIEDYRVDFAFSVGTEKLAVECDGHEFHERTKQQAEKDRSRDRRLQELGYKVFRFTGREIYRDPMRCAEQIVDHFDVGF